MDEKDAQERCMLTVRFEIALALLTGGAARLFYAFAGSVSFAVGGW